MQHLIFKALRFALVFVILFGISNQVLAQFGVSVGVESQSPDRKIITVNGGFGFVQGLAFGVSVDWGDGTISETFYPAAHRYDSPGDYTITATIWNDLSQSAEAVAVHTVPEIHSDVARVVHPISSIGMKTNESVSIPIEAFDDQGQSVEISGRTVEIFSHPSLDSQGFSTEIQNNELLITAPDTELFSSITLVEVYVDGVASEDPIHLVVISSPEELKLVSGTHTELYLPPAFFDANDLSDSEYVLIADLTFLIQRDVLAKEYPDVRKQAISFYAPVFGTSGNPLHLGAFAAPVNGVPQLGLIFHEMGHNFAGPLSIEMDLGAFFQETTAELMGAYTAHTILKEHRDELSSVGIQILEGKIEAGKIFHEAELQRYINNGQIFDPENVGGGSHPLVGMIHRYEEIAGREKLRVLLNLLSVDRMVDVLPAIGSNGGLLSNADKVAFMLAAVSASFGFDVRSDFRDLNFDINETLFDSIISLLNFEPRIDSPLADLNMTVSQDKITIDLASVFADEDGDELVFTATSSDPVNVRVDLLGSILDISALGLGSSTIVVVAEDGHEGSTASEFEVNVLSGVGVADASSNLPESFKVSPNYPNPFYPATTISFELNASGPTQVVVYDMLGRKVAQLVDATMSAGAYETTWNATGYPNGVYIYTVHTGQDSESYFMTVAR